MLLTGREETMNQAHEGKWEGKWEQSVTRPIGDFSPGFLA